MGAVLLLLVLGGWVAVGAWWFTNHREAPTNAIGSFSRQLGSLQQRTPARYGPAGPAARQRPGAPTYRTATAASYQRAQVQRRRRDILSSLALLSAATLVLGFVPSLHLLWVLHVVTDVALGLYVAALLRIRAVAVEREMALRFGAQLPPTPAAVRAQRREQDDDLGFELQPAFARSRG